MSKKKLVFRVGQGLAVTGLALSVAGCPKDPPEGMSVNPAAPDLPSPPPEVNVNTVESPPPADMGGTALEDDSDAGTPRSKPANPIRVNTPAPRPEPKPPKPE